MTLATHQRLCPVCRKKAFGMCSVAIKLLLASPASGSKERIKQDLTKPNRKELNENEGNVPVEVP